MKKYSKGRRRHIISLIALISVGLTALLYFFLVFHVLQESNFYLRNMKFNFMKGQKKFKIKGNWRTSEILQLAEILISCKPKQRKFLHRYLCQKQNPLFLEQKKEKPQK